MYMYYNIDIENRKHHSVSLAKIPVENVPAFSI